MTGAIYSAAEIRRELITLAFVGKEIGRSQDFLSALRPLFVPIAQDFAGQYFEPAKLSVELRSRYGISVPEDVCHFLTGRLEVQGLLARERATQQSALFKWKNPENLAAYNSEEVSDIINKLVNELVKFRDEFPSLVFNEFEANDLLAIFLEYLKTTELNLANAMELVGPQIPTLLPGGKEVYRDEKSYFCARFLSELAVRNAEVMQWVSRLATAALVSEVVLSLKDPPTQNLSIAGATYYLDAPFLLELLGSSGSERKADARYTAERIAKAGASVRVLDHSVEEAHQALSALRNKEAGQRRGPTHVAMLKGEVTNLFLDTLIEQTRFFIEQAGVQVTDTSTARFSPNQNAFFPKKMQEELEGRLMATYNNPRAAERDAKSISFVMRSRGRVRATRIHEARHVFVSRNDTLNGYVSLFLKQNKLLNPGELGPILLANHVTAFIWLASGDKDRTELDVRHLLVQSDRMVQSSPAAIETLKSNLAAVSPQNAETFEALLSVPRCYQLALDLVGGSVQRALTTDPSEVFERVRLETAAEVAQKYKQEIKEVRRRHESKSAELKGQIDDVAQQRAVLEGALRTREQDDVDRANHIFEQISGVRERAIYYGKVVCTLILIGWLTFSFREVVEQREALGGMRRILNVVGGVVLLAGLWYGEGFWKRWLDKMWRSHLNARARDAGVLKHIQDRPWPS